MNEWKPKRLDQLGSVARGKSRHRPRNDPALYGGRWPFFQTGDVKAAELYLHSFSQTYNDAGLAQSKLWPAGTLCITIAANIADTAILGIPGCFPDSVVGFIADPAQSDARFVKYYIETLKQGMQNASRGTTQDNLSVDKLLTFEFLVPSAQRQREIASILSAYDDLIENNTRRIAILEEMARRIYEEWFVRFRFPGHQGVRMVASELGLVPATWRVLPMSAVAEVIDCLHSKKPTEQEDGAGLMLQLFNIANDGILDLTKRFRVSAEDYSLWTSRMEAQEGDCVITNVGRVGAVAQIPQGVKAALGRNMTGVRAKQGAISPTYLLRYLLSSHMESEIVKKKDPGTIMDSLNVKGIVRLSVPVADANTMQAFDRVAAPMRRQVEVLVLKNANLRETRDLLLPKLISGELDVSAPPDPEALAA